MLPYGLLLIGALKKNGGPESDHEAVRREGRHLILGVYNGTDKSKQRGLHSAKVI